MFTSTCALRHDGAHCFDVSTSKSGPSMVCFVHVYFQVCFAPQRRALFLSVTSKSGPNLKCFDTVYFQMRFSPQRLVLFRHRIAIESLKNVLCATTACTFSCWVVYMFTSKCASRHNDAHFFDVLTSKSGPSMVCFVHVHFQVCFAPQRRALFPHRNFQKRSEPEVF